METTPGISRKKITVLNSELMIVVLSVVGLLMYAPSIVAQRKESAHRHSVQAAAVQNATEGVGIVTPDQQKKIDALKTPFNREALTVSNQLREKQAHLQTLQTAEPADLNAINATIDEIGSLTAQWQKKQAAHTQAIRSILTEEQRVDFDERH